MNNTKIKIPPNWQQVKLGDFCSYIVDNRGKTPPVVSEGIPLIEVNAMGSKNVDYTKINKFVSEETFDGWFRKYLKDGDVLFSTVGRTAMTSLYRDSVKAGIAQNIVGLRFDGHNYKFMYYMLSQERNNYKFKSIEMVAVQPSVKVSQMVNLKFNIPPLPEQHRIVTILETWDNAIDLLKKKITLKKQVKKGLMQRLLSGEVRLPGFSGEWKTLKLKTLGDTYAGLSGKTKNDFGIGKPYISYMNIYSNPALSMYDLPLVDVREDERQFTAKYGDLFFTTSSETSHEVGVSSVLLDKDVDTLYLNSFCFAFRLNDFETILPEFAKHYFRGQIFRKSMTRIAQGASRYNLSKRYFMDTEVVIPNIDEQKEISFILQTSENEISFLEQKLQALQQQKKFLLNNLVTGNIRTPEDMKVTA